MVRAVKEAPGHGHKSPPLWRGLEGSGAIWGHVATGLATIQDRYLPKSEHGTCNSPVRIVSKDGHDDQSAH